MQRIVLASSNLGKLKEFAELVKDLPVIFVAQSEFGIEAPEETGLTFIENAILKARFAADMTGLPALADDSGLEVDVLHGAPGIYSARYAGQSQSASAHIAKLLDELRRVPVAKRQARFHSVLAFMRYPNDPSPMIAEGVWEGSILTKPKGEQGFGYDPVFLPQEQRDGRSAAELTDNEKNQQSHRGKAMQVLKGQLQAWLAKQC